MNVGDVKVLPISVFAVVVAVTLGMTWWVSRRERTASEYLAAGRSLPGPLNGLAISGEFVSAGTFLGVTGLFLLFGLDASVYLMSALAGLLLLVLVFAQRLRNIGEYTMADVLSFRMSPRPVRAAAACSTLVIVFAYLLAQLVGGAILFQALAGINFVPAVILTTVLILIYVFFGGMRAITWVQVIKATLLLAFAIILTAMLLIEVDFDLPALLFNAAGASAAPSHFIGPGGLFTNPLEGISLAIAYCLGTAGLPHLLMRFFTVTDAKQAVKSAQYALGVVGVFFAMVMLLGFGAAAVLTNSEVELAGPSGNLTMPVLAEHLGGGSGTVGGEILLAFVATVAFATILAVVSGLVIAASGAVAHDLWGNVFRKGKAQGHETVRAARVTAVIVSVLAAAATMVVGTGFNITFLTAMAFAIAASANLPALWLSLMWKRFNTGGAVAGIVTGLLSSVLLILVGPDVWPFGETPKDAPFPLKSPAIVSVPLSFAACWLGTILTTGSRPVRPYVELEVRAQTGIGAVTAGH